MIAEAFLTGSRAYGTPTSKSDWDICIYCDPDDISTLGAASQLSSTRRLLNIGSVQFLIFTDIDEFHEWQRVTNALVSQRPVTRDFAMEAFCKAGLTGNTNDYV